MGRVAPWSLVALVVAAACVAAPPPPVDDRSFEDVRRIVAGLDDVAGEYPQTVAAGQVIDPVRMRVIARVLHDAQRFAEHLTEADRRPLAALTAAVEGRAAAPAVVAMARALRAELLARRGLVFAPAAPPSWSRASALWHDLCAGCHGETGVGDGAQGLYLEPEPKDFQDAEFMADLAPTRAYSRITDGMPGTAMPSWGLPSISERWGLAQLVFTFRFDAEQVARGRALAPAAGSVGAWSRLADRSDGELTAGLRARGLSDAQAEDVLAYWRAEAAFAPIGGRLADVRAALVLGLEHYTARRFRDAARTLAEARARGVAHADAIAARAPAVAARLEASLARVDGLARAGALDTAVGHEVARAQAVLDDAEAALAGGAGAGTARRAAALIAAALAALVLGAVPAGAARRRGAVLASVTGAAIGGGLGVVAGGAPAPWWALGAAVALARLTPRHGALLERAALAALVGLAVAAVAPPHPGAALAVALGAAGLVAVAGARLRAPAVAGVAGPIAAAVAVGRGAYLAWRADGAAAALVRLPRVEALGLYPVRAAVIAAAAAAAVALAIRGSRRRAG